MAPQPFAGKQQLQSGWALRARLSRRVLGNDKEVRVARGRALGTIAVAR